MMSGSVRKEFLSAIEQHTSGDLASAILGYRRILEKTPAEPDVISALGVALRAAGRNGEGQEVLRDGVAAFPGHEGLNYNFGNALRDSDDLVAALAHYRRVLDFNEDHFGAALNLGLCLEKLKRLDDAVGHYTQLLRHNPDRAEIFHNMGVVLWLQRRLEASVACYRRAVAIKPDYSQAYYNLGLALDALGSYPEGETAFRRALELQPALTDAMSGLGQNLLSQGRPDDAAQWFEAALKQDSEHLDGHLGRVRLNLLTGNLILGWEEFGWHRRRETWQDPKVAGTPWQGDDIAGKSILLYGEQGLGDVIHFSRFANLVARRGATVLIHCPPRLVRILETLEGVGTVVSLDEPPPETDFICSLIDLPRLFGTNLETIADACPYLTSPLPSTPIHRSKGMLNIGLVWAGNPKHQRDRDRSCPLRNFAPLLAVAGTSFFSLQVGPAAQDIAANGLGGLITDIGSGLTDFAMTAEVLSQLDLLISVDTAAAHLAGALAVPVWTLLAYAPDWRWMLDRSDTPWYSTMKLYRQSEPNDWRAVLATVEKDLRNLVVETRGRGLSS